MDCRYSKEGLTIGPESSALPYYSGRRMLPRRSSPTAQDYLVVLKVA